MSNFRVSAESVEVSRRRVEFVSGAVLFIKSFHTDVFEDGSVKEYFQYIKEDNRMYTKPGNVFHVYKSEAAYNTGYYRLASQAKNENL